MSTSPTTYAFTDLSCVKRTFKEINTTSDSKGSLKNIRFSKQFKWVQLSNKMCYYSDVTCSNYIMAYTCYHPLQIHKIQLKSIVLFMDGLRQYDVK